MKVIPATCGDTKCYTFIFHINLLKWKSYLFVYITILLTIISYRMADSLMDQRSTFYLQPVLFHSIDHWELDRMSIFRSLFISLCVDPLYAKTDILFHITGIVIGETNALNKRQREIGNIGYTRRRKTKQKAQLNMCWIPLCASKHN